MKIFVTKADVHTHILINKTHTHMSIYTICKYIYTHTLSEIMYIYIYICECVCDYMLYVYAINRDDCKWKWEYVYLSIFICTYNNGNNPHAWWNEIKKKAFSSNNNYKLYNKYTGTYTDLYNDQDVIVISVVDVDDHYYRQHYCYQHHQRYSGKASIFRHIEK